MKKQIPRGDEGLICPLHKATMDTVCHKCPWWQHVVGSNPNTGDHVDYWNCAIALLPMLTIEVAQQSRTSGAAIESMRNSVDKAHAENMTMNAVAVQRTRDAIRDVVADYSAPPIQIASGPTLDPQP